MVQYLTMEINEDHNNLKEELIITDIQSINTITPTRINSGPSPHTAGPLNPNMVPLLGQVS